MFDDEDVSGTPQDRSRRRLLGGFGLAAAGAALPPRADARPDVTTAVKRPATSRLSGPLQSAGALAFGPDDVLFVGDIVAGAVHAFAFRPSDFDDQTGVVLGNVHNFEGRDLVRGVDRTLAAMLGTTPDQIAINDMVVHRATQQAVFSVERGRSTDAVPLLAKVNRGELELFDLSRIAHTRVSLPDVPDSAAMMEFYPQRSFAITDIKYHDGEIFVSGVSNLEFQSALHRIAFPWTDRIATTTVEIWHPVHGEWETRAPIIRHLIQDVGGTPHLYAVYGCTPLVRFPLASLVDGAHVRGDVIGQLGYGSNPLDMLTFSSLADGKDYLVISIDTRSGSQIAVADLPTAPAEPTGGPIDFSPGGLGRSQGLLPIRAEHLAILDPNWAVQMARHPKTSGRLDISTVALPYFFERHDGESEMNFPDGPDPFAYRTHRGDLSRV